MLLAFCSAPADENITYHETDINSLTFSSAHSTLLSTIYKTVVWSLQESSPNVGESQRSSSRFRCQ